MKDLYYQLSGLKLVSSILFVFTFGAGILLATGASKDHFVANMSKCVLVGSGIFLILVLGASVLEVVLEKRLNIKD